MLLDEVAKDLVHATSELLDGRIVNIMNPEGVIIASTQPERIGTFHKGARDAALSGEPVSIRPDEVSQYSGAREGYNMPLRVGGSIVGVVGIYGEPSEIRYLAHMVEVYTEKYYQLESLLRPQYAQGALRSMVLGKLLDGSEKSVSDAQTLMKSRNFCLQYPVSVVLVSSPDASLLSGEQADAEILRWKEQELLHETEDLWGLIDGGIVLLLSDAPMRKLREFPTDLRLNGSLPAKNAREIQAAYRQTLILDSFTDSSRNLLDDPNTRIRYMLRQMAIENEDLPENLLVKLRAMFPPDEQETLLQTAQCYYHCGKSVTQASEKLFVHKNTLLYRLHKLWDALGLSDSADFQRELTIRLLLEYTYGKQGPRALK